MNNDKYLSITAITRYLKHKIDTDDNLKLVYLKGEISNFKAHSSGHLYFSLKDEGSKINAIMFSSNAKKLSFTPIDGSKVLVIGRISVYEATGNYQIYIQEMIEDGIGNLYIAFEELKKKLSNEGLFDESNKKPIPKMPNRVGIVTAKTGAAIKDILSTIKRRYPVCETILFPSLVQGDGAANDIVENIKKAQNYNLDILIVGRGGGSIEDLWPFNEEIVARAIYSSTVPIISAVGHEVDFTIADFVADMRAPTPTGAAEMSVPNISDTINHLNNLNIRLNESINSKIHLNRMKINGIKNSFILKNPMIIYENKKQLLDSIIEKLNNNLINKVKINKYRLDIIKNNSLIKNPNLIFKDKKNNFINVLQKLELLNPLSIMKRGYSLTYQNNKIIKSIKNINKDEYISVKLHDGVIITKIIEIKEK